MSPNNFSYRFSSATGIEPSTCLNHEALCLQGLSGFNFGFMRCSQSCQLVPVCWLFYEPDTLGGQKYFFRYGLSHGRPAPTAREISTRSDRNEHE